MTTTNPSFRCLPALAAAVSTAVLLSACGSIGPNVALEDARNTVASTGSDPDVVSRAPVELKAARDALQRADQVWNKDHDDAETTHLAYIASQRAAIARNAAQQRRADDEIKTAGSDTDRLRLEQRTREAERARAQAQSATQLAAVQGAQARAAQDRVRQLEAQLRDIEARQTERGLLVTLGDVLFAFDKSELLPAAGPRLDKLAGFLRQFPQRRLLVEGYTDAVGSGQYNDDLSRRRAEAVRSALVQRGVDASRIDARGYGKAYPVADNGTNEGRALNRRVEVVIADENGNLRGR
ncbi:OmpA family protein [Xylophilus sp.]|uniref:OmpA family protein n=1 Tax=Xylophilus sp. TaxID=2653893 RepID=UPI0013BCDB4E|nr:OmpA family protein [Xylophilus sp.]KAF1050233.1 MAG: Outer membrane porin F [Xylophilus sp.]